MKALKRLDEEAERERKKIETASKEAIRAIKEKVESRTGQAQGPAR